MRILHLKTQTFCCEMDTFKFCPKLGFLDGTRVSSESTNTWRLWQQVGIIHPPIPLNSSVFLHFECMLSEGKSTLHLLLCLDQVPVLTEPSLTVYIMNERMDDNFTLGSQVRFHLPKKLVQETVFKNHCHR